MKKFKLVSLIILMSMVFSAVVMPLTSKAVDTDKITAENFNMYLTKIGLGKPHPLLGDLDKCYAIHITKNYRMVVEPLETELDMESLKKCKILNIKGVLDYHGGKNEWIIT